MTAECPSVSRLDDRRCRSAAPATRLAGRGRAGVRRRWRSPSVAAALARAEGSASCCVTHGCPAPAAAGRLRCRRPRSGPVGSVWVAAGHQQADLLARGVGGPTMPTIRPAVHDRDPVGQRRDLVQLAGDDQHRGAARPARRRLRLWMNSIDPTSTPRVGWAAMQQLQRPGHLPGHDDLLLVAAGQRADRRLRRTRCGRRTRSIRSLGRRRDRVQASARCRSRTAAGRRCRAPGSRRR